MALLYRPSRQLSIRNGQSEIGGPPPSRHSRPVPVIPARSPLLPPPNPSFRRPTRHPAAQPVIPPPNPSFPPPNPSFPRKRESTPCRSAIRDIQGFWIPACAGMTVRGNGGVWATPIMAQSAKSPLSQKGGWGDSPPSAPNRKPSPSGRGLGEGETPAAADSPEIANAAPPPFILRQAQDERLPTRPISIVIAAPTVIPAKA